MVEPCFLLDQLRSSRSCNAGVLWLLDRRVHDNADGPRPRLRRKRCTKSASEDATCCARQSRPEWARKAHSGSWALSFQRLLLEFASVPLHEAVTWRLPAVRTTLVQQELAFPPPQCHPSLGPSRTVVFKEVHGLGHSEVRPPQNPLEIAHP